ncbi:CpaF family protein [Actinophytocola sediminis]
MTTTQYRPTSASDRLRTHLRQELARQLPTEVDAAQHVGEHPVSPARREELARRILNDAVRVHSERELRENRLLLAPDVEQRVVVEVLNELFGMAGLQPLLDDPDIETININGHDRVLVQYTGGRRALLAPVADSDAGLRTFLAALVRARRNIIVTGGTSIGKTTMLRALASEIDPMERLVTIEDTRELGLDHDPAAHADVVSLQAREANIEGEGAVTQADLVRWALRMSPDRVIVGEIRGPEVVPMCLAMSQGNDGSLATLHASSSRSAFTRLASYAALGADRLPLEATNLLVGGAVHFIVHLAHATDGTTRVVSSIREVVGAEGDQVISNEIYRPGPDRRAIPVAGALRTETLRQLNDSGLDPAFLESSEDRWRR